MAEKILIDKVPYYLPLTRIRMHGKRTIKTIAGDSKAVTDDTSEVTVDLVTSADPNHLRYIHEADNLVADHKLSIEWAEKGFLSSTDATSTGKLGEIVRNIFGAVLRLGFFFAAPVRRTAVGPPISPDEKEYENKFPNLYAVRKAAKEAVIELLKAIAEGSKSLASETDPTQVKARHERLKQLASALTELKKEAEALEAHFNSWRAGAEQSEVIVRDVSVDLSALPQEEAVSELQGKTKEQMRETLKSLHDVFFDLGVVVAVATTWSQPEYPTYGGKPPVERPDDARGIEFRLPRPALLSLFEIKQDTGTNSTTFSTVLKERRDVSIIDDRCATAMLRIKGSHWASKSLDMDFAADGTPRKITTDAGAQLAAFAETLSKLPAEALQSLKDANAFVDERQKLALQAIEQHIEELKKQKEAAQARIALNETLATEEQAAEIKRLDQEILLLQKQVQLKQLSGKEALDLQLKLVQIEAELVKARTALEQAEIDRLAVQAELNQAQKPENESRPRPNCG